MKDWRFVYNVSIQNLPINESYRKKFGKIREFLDVQENLIFNNEWMQSTAFKKVAKVSII